MSEQDFHPKRFPIPVESDSVNTGRNAESVPYHDGRYVRCSRCGFVCHSDRDMFHAEDSRAENGVDYTTTYGSASRIEPIVQSGCPFCGSLRWHV